MLLNVTVRSVERNGSGGWRERERGGGGERETERERAREGGREGGRGGGREKFY
jgi:hypothetical protein